MKTPNKIKNQRMTSRKTKMQDSRAKIILKKKVTSDMVRQRTPPTLIRKTIPLGNTIDADH